MNKSKNMLAIFISWVLAARVLIDISYPNEKPAALVALYTAMILIASILLIAKSRKIQGTKKVSGILFLAVVLMASAINSNIDFFQQLNFSTQIFIPIFFLLACTSSPSTLQETGRIFKKFFAIPSLLMVIVFSIDDYNSNNIYSLDFFSFYANNPNHVLTQTALKVSLVFLDSAIMLAAVFILLGILNVRSTIIAFILAVATFYKSSLLNKNNAIKLVAAVAALALLVILFVDMDKIIERFMFRGRTEYSAADLSNLTSGRTEIYEYYINYLFHKFTLVNWLFGAGPIWLSSFKMTLSAHNDILNLIIAFGIIGFGFVIFSYYIFFASLAPRIRLSAASVFICLFLTNGVVFHQSTILFALLYFYNGNQRKEHDVFKLKREAGFRN